MTRPPHYLDVGQEPPDPGSPRNRRILALLDEAIARSDSARKSLDAVDAVLAERAESGDRTALARRRGP